MSHFIFRADGGPEIGLGHVMRDLSIADACRRQGHTVLFVVADGEMVSRIGERGYECFVLGTDYREMEKELPKWKDVIVREGLDDIVLVVDSYFVTDKYLRKLRDAISGVRMLVYIDDRAAFPYPVDVVVNYNVYAGADVYEALYGEEASGGRGYGNNPDRRKCESDERAFGRPKMILGARYAPLREDFVGVFPREQRRDVADVLISTGGSDTEHIMLRVLEELLRRENRLCDESSDGSQEDVSLDVSSDVSSGSECPEGVNAKGKSPEDEKPVRYHLLLGVMNRDEKRIKELAGEDRNIVIHENVSDMKGLICSCDIVLSAAGSTLYEICACGVPAVTYSLADNQLPGERGFERLGLAESAGDIREMEDPAKVLLDRIDKLAGDYNRRVMMGKNMQNLVDGRGAERLVGGVLNSSLITCYLQADKNHIIWKSSDRN